MNDSDPARQEELHTILVSLNKRVQRLTVAVVLMTLAVFLLFWAEFGSLANYFGGDPLLFGGVSVGAALLGFFSGWFARRRA
jgi:membrane associated rhomboid family serine protease